MSKKDCVTFDRHPEVPLRGNAKRSAFEELISASGLSIGALAIASGWPQWLISRIAHGHRVVTHDVVAAIAQALHKPEEAVMVAIKAGQHEVAAKNQDATTVDSRTCRGCGVVCDQLFSLDCGICGTQFVLCDECAADLSKSEANQDRHAAHVDACLALAAAQKRGDA